jgi:hypothetical protein
MARLVPIICDNGTGYSKIGWVLIKIEFLCLNSSLVLLVILTPHCMSDLPD